MKKTRHTARDLLWNALTSGSGDRLKTGERYRVVFLNAVTFFGGITLAAFSIISFSSGNPSLGASTAAATVLVFLNLVAIRLFKRFFLGGVVDCALIFVLYFSFALSGGESGSGILWSMTYPLITLFLLGAVAGSAVSAVYGIALGVVILVPSLNASGFPLLYSIRVLGAYFFICLFALIYEVVRSATQSRLARSNEELSLVTQELKAEKKQSDDILAGVEEGIFLLSGDLRLGDSHSLFLERIFERGNLAGQKLMDILGPGLGAQDRSAASDYLEMFLKGKLSPELLADINPFSEIRCVFRAGQNEKEKFLRLTFIRVGGDESAFPILAVAMDVTDEVRLKRRLESEEREHRRSMESLFQIIHVDPAMLKEFVTDTEAEFESVNELMRQEGSSGSEILETLYQSMHAVKGNAILLGLKEFGLKVHDYETVVRDTIKAGHEWRDLLSLTLGLADLSAELESLKGLIGEILSFQLQTEKAGLTETSLFQAGFEKMVAKESQRLGVPASCEFSGLGKKGVPDRHRRLLKDILAQLIRNSFAHGFEGPDERQAKGKGRKGRISLAAEWAEGSYLLRYRDDGRGLDPERIRRKALAMPEFAEAAAGMDDSGLARLIFKPGFSTSEGSDLGSGRGIGMALVMRRITEAGGRLSLKSGKGKYLEFAIRLPVPEAETGPWA